ADNITRTVQYFERARLEVHVAPTSGEVKVELGLLGRELTAGLFFVPARFSVTDRGHAYFGETQHSIGGAFYPAWRDQGGLARFGYPISEEINPGPHVYQWFERARFEYTPAGAGTDQEVSLGLLGVEALR